MEYSNEDLEELIRLSTQVVSDWERKTPVMSMCFNFEQYLKERNHQLEQVKGYLKQLVMYQEHLINNLKGE